MFDRIALWARRVRTPRVIQMEAVECGAAALCIVLGYYKRFVSLEELRLTCGVSRDGISAFDLIQAARYYGMEAEGYQGNWDALIELPTPAILYWDANHFVVLEGIFGNKVCINDPAVGPYTLSLEEGQRHFSNVAIILKPSIDFVKKGESFSLFSRLHEKFVSAKNVLGYLCGIEFLFVVLGLTIPAFTKIFIDTFLITGLPSWKLEFLYFISAIGIALAAIAWFKGRFINRLQIVLSVQSSARFFQHLISLSISFFSQRYAADLIQRIQLNARIAQLFTQGIIVNLVNLVMILFYGIILFTYNQVIALIGVGTAIFDVVLLYFINKARTNAYARLLQENAKALGISLDTLENIETIKSLPHASNYFFSRLAGYYTNSINAYQNIGKKDIWLFSFSELAMTVSNLVLLAVGSWVVMQGELTIGMLIAFQIILGFFLNPFRSLVEFGTQLQSFKVDLARIDDVLQHPSDPLTTLENTPLEEKLGGEIEFCNVVFGYAPLEKPYFEQLNLKVKKNEFLSVVGKVGSGKTTFAKLASGLYQPWSGAVLIDGKNILNCNRSTLKISLASVDQEVKLFEGSVFENITLWDSEATEEMVYNAAQRAAIHTEILHFPLGYQTQIREDGANLSSGQKQRIELARALLYSPSIIVLDEAVNSVDSETQRLIFNNLRQMNITIILIAHRLNTIKECDRIIYMEDGKIGAEGTHADLMQESTSYRELFSNQNIIDYE